MSACVTLMINDRAGAGLDCDGSPFGDFLSNRNKIFRMNGFEKWHFFFFPWEKLLSTASKNAEMMHWANSSMPRKIVADLCQL